MGFELLFYFAFFDNGDNKLTAKDKRRRDRRTPTRIAIASDGLKLSLQQSTDLFPSPCHWWRRRHITTSVALQVVEE